MTIKISSHKKSRAVLLDKTSSLVVTPLVSLLQTTSEKSIAWSLKLINRSSQESFKSIPEQSHFTGKSVNPPLCVVKVSEVKSIFYLILCVYFFFFLNSLLLND